MTISATNSVGVRGGVCWASLQLAMSNAGHDCASLADALRELGESVTERGVDSWLRGQREPTITKLELAAQILGVGVGDLLAGRPRKL